MRKHVGNNRRWLTAAASGIIMMLALAVFSGFAADTAQAGEKKTLTIWHTYTSDTQIDGFEATLHAYEEANPDVTLEIAAYSTSDIITNLNMAVLSGTMPDIAILDNPKFAALVEAGVYQPITEWFYGWEESQYFKENCLDMGTIDGELYGILYDPCGLAFWCNKELIEKAGYTEAPKNWADFEEMAMACTDPDAGVYGFATSTREEEEGSTFQHGAFIYTSGTTIYDLSTQGATDYFELVDRLYANGCISMESLDWTQGDAYNQFLAGNAAMILSGDWNIPTYINPANNTLGIEAVMAEIPKYDDEHPSVTLFGGEMVGVTNNCDDLELAYDFLQFWLTKDSIKQIDLAIGKLSPRSDLSDEEIYEGTEMMEYKTFYEPIIDNAVPRGPDARWMDMSDAFRDCLQAIAMDVQEPADAQAECVERIKEIVGE